MVKTLPPSMTVVPSPDTPLVVRLPSATLLPMGLEKSIVPAVVTARAAPSMAPSMVLPNVMLPLLPLPLEISAVLALMTTGPL